MVWKPLTRLARTALICRSTYPTLDGVNVFKANDIVIALLQEKGALLHVEKMQHSYPCCWRHKTPIIFRATPQWFVSMDQKVCVRSH